jgi:CheY-like chemotaxis protein
MPNMDGIEFIGSVRKDPVYQDLPIIMLTTDSTPDNRRLAFEAGANLYLVNLHRHTSSCSRYRAFWRRTRSRHRAAPAVTALVIPHRAEPHHALLYVSG